MTRDEAMRLIRDITEEWVLDQESDVVWAGEHEGRWGIRLAQRTRDFSTIWFDVGERTVGYETYLLPGPTRNHAGVYRYCLARNHTAWPVAISMDRSGDLFVRGRIPLEETSKRALDGAVGAVYELVEISFRPLIRLGFAEREKTR